MPPRVPHLHANTAASSSGGYRSVIDDLTIQNKKLKRRLRKYERYSNPQMQSDKVVEIRTFNMPADKKRELEEVLKKFTLTLEGSQSGTPSAAGVQRSNRAIRQTRKSQSHTSTKFGDSAYASMSFSRGGLNSNTPSGQGTNQPPPPNQHAAPGSGPQQSVPGSSHQHSVPDSSHQQSAPDFSHQQDQTIRSYLKDIPAGLLPRSGPVAMTERAKRKLVVRRLEQIFAGRNSAIGGHQHPQQQQEVSQSAAQADRKAIEDRGQTANEEGAREAQIMHEIIEGQNNNEPPKDSYMPVDVEMIVQQDFASDSFEQRPTRPLDLDPFRAQVPAENIKYFRHLGFSPLDFGSTDAHPDGHGWIYLNLLINMAQLHTLNVTADFVRKSVAEFSDKLEVSLDGRRLRWSGGTHLTRTSSDSSPENGHGMAGTNPSKSDLKKKRKSKLSTAISSNDGSSENVSKSTPNKKLYYTPLFFHRQEMDDDMSDDDDSLFSSQPPALAGGSSGLVSSSMHTASAAQKKCEDGPMIFYNRTNFCTDLSGDPRGKNLVRPIQSTYGRLDVAPIGEGSDVYENVETLLEGRGPLSQAQLPVTDEMQVDSRSTSGVEMDIDRPATLPSVSSNEHSSDVIDFEASGIGGVVPGDNFSIRVQTRRGVNSKRGELNTMKSPRHSKPYPQGIRDILKRGEDTSRSSPGKDQRIVREHVVSERRKQLPPSALPPPSFLPTQSPETDDEDSAEDSGVDEDLSVSAAALAAVHRPLPSAAPQLVDWPACANEDSSEESEDDDDDDEESSAGSDGSSSGSVDLLATAREVDPMAIRVQEREYDSQVADRLAEEIPTGSSAATAGGGSGFNTPTSNADVANTSGKPVTKSILKRSRTNNPIAGSSRPRKSIRVDK